MEKKDKEKDKIERGSFVQKIGDGYVVIETGGFNPTYEIMEFIIERTEKIVKSILLDKNLPNHLKFDRLKIYYLDTSLEDLKRVMIKETMERIRKEMKNKEIDKIYYDLMYDEDIREKSKNDRWLND
jgi:hypothetical protein